jgi:hypothetical protein
VVAKFTFPICQLKKGKLNNFFIIFYTVFFLQIVVTSYLKMYNSDFFLLVLKMHKQI